ncbi:transposase [Streptomyces sp. NPDC013161]|uniref:transposase n=1 Tax=Streptomyces sp. NPDC013161 TaxID=3364862 RepID=UPI0036A976AB
MDGKALSGSGHRHLLSAVTHAPTVTPAQREVGAKTNETAAFRTAAFRPLLQPLDLAGTVVTFHTLHYNAVIKGNQPAASTQLKALPWEQVPVAHTDSRTGHGRRESRSVKTMAIAAKLGGIAFPGARLALRIHRRLGPRPDGTDHLWPEGSPGGSPGACQHSTVFAPQQTSSHYVEPELNRFYSTT